MILSDGEAAIASSCVAAVYLANPSGFTHMLAQRLGGQDAQAFLAKCGLTVDPKGAAKGIAAPLMILAGPKRLWSASTAPAASAPGPTRRAPSSRP